MPKSDLASTRSVLVCVSMSVPYQDQSPAFGKTSGDGE